MILTLVTDAYLLYNVVRAVRSGRGGGRGSLNKSYLILFRRLHLLLTFLSSGRNSYGSLPMSSTLPNKGKGCGLLVALVGNNTIGVPPIGLSAI